MLACTIEDGPRQEERAVCFPSSKKGGSNKRKLVEYDISDDEDVYDYARDLYDPDEVGFDLYFCFVSNSENRSHSNKA